MACMIRLSPEGFKGPRVELLLVLVPNSTREPAMLVIGLPGRPGTVMGGLAFQGGGLGVLVLCMQQYVYEYAYIHV